MAEWVENVAQKPKGRYAVLDAMGVPVDGVIRVRETADGVEAQVQLVTEDGAELVEEVDGELKTLTATAHVRGGMLIDLQEDNGDG